MKQQGSNLVSDVDPIVVFYLCRDLDECSVFMFNVRNSGFAVSLDTRGLCSCFCMSVLVNQVILRSKPNLVSNLFLISF